MKKIISFITVSLFAFIVFAKAAEHIILVQATEESRIKLHELYGSALKMQLQSTGEMVLIQNASLSEVQKKVPGAIMREVTAAELDRLKGNQLKGH